MNAFRGIDIRHGDSRAVLKTLPDASIDSVVTDPPYALVSVVQRFGNSPRNERTENPETPHGRTGCGFMGQKWDTGEVAHDVGFWREVLRVLKPGGHLIAFGGTRTYHRLAVAIEDAGFEIRDMIGWLYGSGFPKSHDVAAHAARVVTRTDGDTDTWCALVEPLEGQGTALKPAQEPCVLARKPLIGTVAENVLAHGTGALNIDVSRIHSDDAQGGTYTVKRLKPGATLEATCGNWRPETGALYHGKLKPGRFPANVIHDGSQEVVAAFPAEAGAFAPARGTERSAPTQNVYGKFQRGGTTFRADSGSAARFFYSAKADAEDRCGSKHPTVKPVDLMAYLCRLVTPPGGTVLDPFAGSGTTGMACLREGFNAILIEREAKYVADIRRRVAHVSGLDAPLFAAEPPPPPASQGAESTGFSRTKNRPGRIETVST